MRSNLVRRHAAAARTATRTTPRRKTEGKDFRAKQVLIVGPLFRIVFSILNFWIGAVASPPFLPRRFRAVTAVGVVLIWTALFLGMFASYVALGLFLGIKNGAMVALYRLDFISGARMAAGGRRVGREATAHAAIGRWLSSDSTIVLQSTEEEKKRKDAVQNGRTTSSAVAENYTKRTLPI